MKTIMVAVAAATLLAATLSTFAQQGFNGSAIGNVLQNPASGCGYGFGYSGPGCPHTAAYCSAAGHCYYRYGPRGSDWSGEAMPARAPRASAAPAR